MHEDLLTRIGRIGSDVIGEGRHVAVSANGEGYYSFAITNPDGVRSTVPTIWLAPNSTDRELHDKLAHEFQLAFNPESEPGDLAAPNLQNEGQQKHLGP